MSAEAYAALVDDNAQSLDQDVRSWVAAGRRSHRWRIGLAERERMKAPSNAAIEGVDALLTPTPMPPALPVVPIDRNTAPAMLTRWVNFLDTCVRRRTDSPLAACRPHWRSSAEPMTGH